HRSNLAEAKRSMARDQYRPIDIWRIATRAPLGRIFARDRAQVTFIDDHLLAGTDLPLQPSSRNCPLLLHEAMPALLLHLLRNRVRQCICWSAGNRLIAEASGMIELRLIEPVDENPEIILRLAWKSDDESRTKAQIRTVGAPTGNSLQRLLLHSRTFHCLQHRRSSMLERNVEIRQNSFFCH